MRVVAGSHLQHRLRYEEIRKEGFLFGRKVISDDVYEKAVVNLELNEEECHFHDGFTVHASNSK